jgi:arylsulfatase A-like enzyme
VVDAPASLVDVAPTVLAALRLPAPREMQGRSLLAPAPVERAPLLAEATCSGPELKALRWPDAKYIAAFPDGADDGVALDARAEQLFDLSRDAREQRDLAGADRARAGRLRRELIERVTALRGAARQGEHAALDAEAQERLRALGYVR